MTHESALHRLALYVHQSDTAVILWICVIAIVVIAGIGWGCVAVSTAPEDK